MKMTSEKARLLVDLCAAICFLAVAAGKYIASLADLHIEED